MTQPPSPDQPQPPYGAPPQTPYGAPPYAPPSAPAPYGAPAHPGIHQYAGQPPYGAPPAGPQPPYHAPPAGPQPPYGQPPAAPPAPYGQPPYAQPQHSGYGYGQAGRSPFDEAMAPVEPAGLPTRTKPPSGWNSHALGIVAIVLVLLGVMVVWPQFRARKTEAEVRPLVHALSHRDAGARCPRYLTAVLTDVGSVQYNENGQIADRTDLTGPVCAGLRHLYASGGRQELSCLVGSGICSEEARRSVVAISVVAHESMHLRGQLDEGRAECESIGESQTISTALGIPLDEARMISYLHWTAMNPNTPPQYHVTAENCEFAADLANNPPGNPGARETLTQQVQAAWIDLAT